MMPVLFVLAGIQKMCFLPPALVLLGMSDALRDTASDGTNENSVSVSNILAQVLRAKLRDPLVLGILCGTLYNIVGPAKLLDHSHDATPWTIGGYTPGLFGGSWVHPYITMVCTTLGAAFTPLIFVFSGAASVGIYASLLDWDNIVLPLALVVLKSVVLPTITVYILDAWGVEARVRDFAFRSPLACSLRLAQTWSTSMLTSRDRVKMPR
jgi:hypothetical protein